MQRDGRITYFQHRILVHVVVLGILCVGSISITVICKILIVEMKCVSTVLFQRYTSTIRCSGDNELQAQILKMGFICSFLAKDGTGGLDSFKGAP